MAFEKQIPAVSPRPFTADGGTLGQVQIADSRGFKVGAKAVIVAVGKPDLTVKIKRVLSETLMLVGPVDSPYSRAQWTDISAYTVSASAYIYAEAQEKAKVPANDRDEATFDQEPTVARRNVLVDQLGRYYEQANPLPVQLSGGSVFIENVNNNVSVFLSHRDNDPISGDVHDSIRIGNGVNELAINSNLEALVHDQDALAVLNTINTTLQNEFGTSDSKLDVLHSDNLIIEGKQDTSNTSLASIDSKVATAANQTLELTKLDTLHADNLVIEGKLDTLHVDNTTIESKLDTANTNLTAINSSTAGLDTDLNAFKSANHTDLLSIKTDIDSTNTKLDTANTTLATLSTSANQTTEITKLTSIDGHLDINLSTRATETTLSALNSKVTNDFGVSSAAIRTAAQIGNAGGTADYNSGATSAQTLRTASNLYDSAGNALSSAVNVSSNRMLHVQEPDTVSSSTALGILNAVVTIAVTGLASVGFQINAGTLIGTIQAQSSLDGGSTWQNVPFYDPSNSTVSNSITFGSANSLKILSILPVGGSSHVQVKVTAYTSGTANGLLRASNILAAAGAVTAAAFGTVTNTFVSLTASVATLVLAANSNRKYAYISNPTASTITLQLGSSTGLTSTSRGLVIPSNSFFELKGDNLFTGNVYAFTTSGSVTLSVAEGTP